MATIEPALYLDTHVLVWLYAGSIERFPDTSRELLNSHALFISPMVLLELQYLHEIKKLRVDGRALVDDLSARVEIEICDQDFGRVIGLALRESWTRDPFDRIIVSQARSKNARLLSKDSVIRTNYKRTAWD